LHIVWANIGVVFGVAAVVNGEHASLLSWWRGLIAMVSGAAAMLRDTTLHACKSLCAPSLLKRYAADLLTGSEVCQRQARAAKAKHAWLSAVLRAKSVQSVPPGVLIVHIVEIDHAVSKAVFCA
jgi:hypothetical protein